LKHIFITRTQRIKRLQTNKQTGLSETNVKVSLKINTEKT